MKTINKFCILIIAALMILSSSQTCFAADSGMVYADNPELQLKTIDGDLINTAAAEKAKIIIFFNTTCGHCDKMLEEMRNAELNTAEVDIIMAESHDADPDETAAYAIGKDMPELKWCYDAKEACWRYLYTCGYSDKITVKPVIFYISTGNKIMGYTYSYENIFECAEKYGISLIETKAHEHSWTKQCISAAYCRRGFNYLQCEVCGAIKDVKTIAGLGPCGTTISSISSGKGSFCIKWKEMSEEDLEQVCGYQIRYSKSVKMKNAKVVTVEDNSLTSTKVRGLKSGKKYYVQVRTYAKTGSPDDSMYEFRINQRYYSTWSKARSVTVR